MPHTIFAVKSDNMWRADKTYIIVDDSYFSQLFLMRTVSRIRPDFTLIGCADETMAMKELINGNKIDLIITRDIVSDGNVVEVLKSNSVRIPTILISQSDEKRAAGEGINMVQFILEPVAVSELSDAFGRV